MKNKNSSINSTNIIGLLIMYCKCFVDQVKVQALGVHLGANRKVQRNHD